MVVWTEWGGVRPCGFGFEVCFGGVASSVRSVVCDHRSEVFGIEVAVEILVENVGYVDVDGPER